MIQFKSRDAVIVNVVPCMNMRPIDRQCSCAVRQGRQLIDADHSVVNIALSFGLNFVNFKRNKNEVHKFQKWKNVAIYTRVNKNGILN